MSTARHDQAITYRVVVNHEGQYSIWAADRDLPRGWDDAGKSGPREECLAFIEETWTDMRPLSLRGEDGRRPVISGAGPGRGASRSEP